MSAGVEENGSINPAVVGIDLGFSGRKPRGFVIDQRFSSWGKFPRENSRNGFRPLRRAPRFERLVPLEFFFLF